MAQKRSDDPRVAAPMQDSKNPYRMLLLCGITDEVFADDREAERPRRQIEA
jgi:hypothetical protein